MSLLEKVREMHSRIITEHSGAREEMDALQKKQSRSAREELRYRLLPEQIKLIEEHWRRIERVHLEVEARDARRTGLVILVAKCAEPSSATRKVILCRDGTYRVLYEQMYPGLLIESTAQMNNAELEAIIQHQETGMVPKS